MEDRDVKEKLYLQEEAQSPEETQIIALRFAGIVKPGDLVAFYGDLGSGKTFFIKTLCHALGCAREATSPSFTIINEYEARQGLLVYHFDFYRLESEAELVNLGLDEFFYNDYLCLVEWADKIQDYLPAASWEIYLDFIAHHPENRRITIKRKEDGSND